MPAWITALRSPVGLLLLAFLIALVVRLVDVSLSNVVIGTALAVSFVYFLQDLYSELVAKPARRLRDRVAQLELDTAILRDESATERATIRRLSADAPEVDVPTALEAASAAAFARLVRQATPLTLRRVFQCTFAIADTDWCDRLSISPDELAYVQTYGERIHEIVIEEWSTHRSIRLAVGPWAQPHRASCSAGAHTTPVTERTVQLYATAFNDLVDYAVLWELPFGPDRAHQDLTELMDDGRAPRVQLRFDNQGLRLGGIHGRFGQESLPDRDEFVETHLLLELPLDASRLQPFQRKDDAFDPENADLCIRDYSASPELTDYVGEASGVRWSVRVHDFEALAAL